MQARSRFRILAVAALWLACVPAMAAELLMFERAGCVWCQRWEREVGVLYPKTPEGQRAPLRHVNLDRPLPRDLKLAAPTFVLMAEGREIGRITGYIGDDAFWGLLTPMMIRLDNLDTAD
jgi:hypothetical protein